MRFVIFVQLNIKSMFGFCFLKLFLRTFFEKKTKNTEKVLSESSSLFFKFNVFFVFYVFQKMEKPNMFSMFFLF